MTRPPHETHYDVLGVEPESDGAEIRRAYLQLARDHHPDRHAAGSDAPRHGAERRMQAINDAWRVLGDPERRRRYDSSLATGDAGSEPDEPTFTWRPFEDGGLGVDDPDPFGEANARRPAGGRLLALVPVGFLVAGAGSFLLGALVDLPLLMALGLSGVVLAVVLFVLAPLFVVLDSRRHDRL